LSGSSPGRDKRASYRDRQTTQSQSRDSRRLRHSVETAVQFDMLANRDENAETICQIILASRNHIEISAIFRDLQIFARAMGQISWEQLERNRLDRSRLRCKVRRHSGADLTRRPGCSCRPGSGLLIIAEVLRKSRRAISGTADWSFSSRVLVIRDLHPQKV
jgi:hypothetical protein